MVVHVFRHPVRGFFETFMFVHVHVHVFSMLCPLCSWLSCSWSMISSMFPWLSYSSWFVVFMSSWFLTCGVHVHVFMFMHSCSCVFAHVFMKVHALMYSYFVVSHAWCSWWLKACGVHLPSYTCMSCVKIHIYIFIDIYYVHWQILNLNMYSLYQ